MKSAKFTLAIWALFTLSACSNHWREVGVEITAADMESILAEVDQATAQGLGSGDLTTALALRNDINASVYYSEAPGPMGNITNVVGFADYGFLGQGPDFGYANIREARVIFIDAPQADGSRITSLIIGLLTTGDQFNYYAFTGTGSLGGGSYQATLAGADKVPKVKLKSYDVSSEGLDTVIQLRVYDAAGNYLGKVSTLVGFRG